MGIIEIPATSSTSAHQRDSLDTSVERELKIGVTRATALKPRLRALLKSLVEAELLHPGKMTEAELVRNAAVTGLLRELRLRHAVDALVDLGLARRERLVLRPTVAGIAAVTTAEARATVPGLGHGVLRQLRQAEIGTF